MSEPVTTPQTDVWKRPHVLIVREVGESYGSLSTDEFVDCEVEHFPDCPQTVHGWDDETWTVFECGVGYEQREDSLRWSLKYSGTPIDKPGRYLIEPWFEKNYVWDCGAYEYDGGVILADGVGGSTQ